MSDRSRPARVALALGLALLMVAEASALSGGSVAAAPSSEPTSDPPPPTIPVVSPDGPACEMGFESTETRAGVALLGVTQTGRGALAVGFSRISLGDELGTRRPAAVTRVGNRWSRIPIASGGSEDGLVAVTKARTGRAWAVGFTSKALQTMPLAMYWNGRRWRVGSPKPVSAMTTILTDVAMVGDWPFAVGYRATAGGQSRPVAVRREGRRWRYVNPRTGPRESVSLTGVSSDRRGGLWVVGYGGPGSEFQPIIFRRAKGDWTRLRTPRLRVEGILSDVVATAADDAWAVGYQRTGSRTVPLVLHWDGRDWQRSKSPDFGSDEVVLTAVSTSPDGGIWVVGAAWDSESRSHRAMAAWWDGRAWNPVSAVGSGSELHDVTGSLASDGWAVGRVGLRSLTARVCLPPQASVFGGYEDAPHSEADDPDSDHLASSGTSTSATTAVEDDTASLVGPSTDIASAGGPSSAGPGSGSRELAAQRKRADRKRGVRRAHARRVRHHRGVRRLPSARADARIVARDVARQAGVADSTASYGAVVADFDGDGVDDLLIARHGRPARLVLNRGGRFVDHPTIDFPPIDRHGCDAADVDGSGLPDLYCAIGGKRGSGLKADELWLDPGGPEPVEAAVEHGLSDPTSRGRRAVFLESDDSDRIDLVVTNSSIRVDGLPSVGRRYRTSGDGMFTATARPGFAAGLGSLSMQAADVDRDGRDDLVLVTGGFQAPRAKGMRLYRNTARGLVDVTRQMGIRDIDDMDAELLDVDGDGRLDLAQVSPTRLRISLQRRGRFQLAYQRRVSYGRALASGDVNGDGRDDLYIVRGNGVRNHPDVLLVSRDGGRAWSSMPIPQVSGGVGEDAVAIDHDGNGLDDFLVLNGFNARGPVQLIAFYERRP
jgi:hypothetical protein